MNEATPQSKLEIAGTKLRALLAALAAAALTLLFLAPQAEAIKYVDRIVTGGAAPGTATGQFDTIRGIAINDPTVADDTLDPQGASTDGYLYAVDEFNHRIQAFDADGDFKFMFGRGVDSGAAEHEVCTSSCQAGATGAAEGEFNRPRRIDVNQQTGDLYVTDSRNRRVQQFSAAGEFIRAWGWGVSDGTAAFQVCNAPADLPCGAGVAGGNGGQFGAETLNHISLNGITVDPAAPHHVFVGDVVNARIQEFTANGQFVRLWGWDVVPTGQPGDRGDSAEIQWFDPLRSSFEICTSTTAGRCKAADPTPHNVPPRNGFLKGGPGDIVVDGDSGNVYVASNSQIHRFDSDEQGVEQLLLPMLTRVISSAGDGVVTEISQSGAEALALDPDSGGLLVSSPQQFGGLGAGPSHTRLLDTDAEPPVRVEDHLVATGLGISDLVVDPAGGDFYFGQFSGHRIFAADDDGANPAPVVFFAPAVVNGLDVSLSGTVTPGGPPGFNVTYNFQISKDDGATWVDIPATDNPLGDGNTPVPVSDEVTGLDPNTPYKVRLLTRKAFGNPDVASTSQAEFTTDPLPAEAKTTSPAVRRTTSARLAGRVNPNNTLTDYHFKWGTDTSYGSQVPVPDGQVNGFGFRGVFAAIGGLQPNTTYHYRLFADNGVGPEAVGDDVSFTTRALGTPPPVGERAYEMVTPPFKVARGTGAPVLPSGNNPNPSVASLGGESVSWAVHLFPLTDEVRHPMNGDRRLIRRTDSGWVSSTRNTLQLIGDPESPAAPNQFTKFEFGGSSGDFETQTFKVGDNLPEQAGLLPTEGAYANRLYTRRDGVGIEGFTPWLTNPEQQVIGYGFTPKDLANERRDIAILNDSGSAMARWGWYRGLAGGSDPSVSQLAGKAGGTTGYLQRAATPAEMPTAPLELINGCTGTTAGGNATQIPLRQGAGVETDTIAASACQQGSVTSRRGATVGSSSAVGGNSFVASRNSGTAATALSDDGERVYFQSPDFSAEGVPDSACTTVTGANTSCVPQLYVRTHKTDGTPVVRWISRSRSVVSGKGYSGAIIAGQRVGLMGAGVAFQGASRDGSVVYFKTNAPLTPDDPNGTGAPGPKTTGTASDDSWDLYRFELPADPDADPDAGVLTRISGGPSGTADPSTNVAGGDAPLRFHSDDGKRAYFLTTSPIPGADTTPPSGGDTTPGGAPGNISVRNLYLFDEEETGAERYRFIARIPYKGGSGASNEAGPTKEGLNQCASSSSRLSDQLAAYSSEAVPLAGSCFRGTPDGRAVAFATLGQLTGDDGDEAGDVYLYDATADELVRVSAPPAGETPYGCNLVSGAGGTGSMPVLPSQIVARCNAELGRSIGVPAIRNGLGLATPIGSWEQSRGWAGMRYYNLATDENGVVSLFFASKLALIPEDENDHFDVYEWRAGELSLVSPGDSPDHAWFAGNSTDGEDVFFQTSQRIDPREVDDADLDIYDARVGGGFPYTPPPPPCDVLAFACESEAASGPAARGSATAGFSGVGNVRSAAARCNKNQVRRGKRCIAKRVLAKRACAKRRGKAKQRCVRNQVRRLNKVQQRQTRANAARRAGR